MATDNKKNKLIYIQKRKAIEESISENPTYRTMINSLSDEGVHIDLEQFVDEYISFLGIENLENNSALDFVELNKFIIGKINHVSQEKNGIVLNDDGTKNDKASTEQKIDIMYDETLDYAENLAVENEFIDKSINMFFLSEELSQQENNFYEKVVFGNANENDIFDNLKYQETNNKDKVLNAAEINRLETFIETRDELNFILMCTNYENTSNPKEKEIYLDKILELPYSKNFIDSETERFDIDRGIDISKKWGENHLKSRRKLDMIEYINLRKSGIGFSELSNEDKNRFLRSAVRVFENQNASMETKKIANAVLMDISPELLNVQKDKNGNIVTSINNESLLSIYNMIHPDEKNFESLNQITDIIQKEEDNLILNKLEDIRNAKTLMRYEEWEKINVSRENEILGISKEIKDIPTKENDNPFRVSNDIIENTIRVGKEANEKLQNVNSNAISKQENNKNDIDFDQI